MKTHDQLVRLHDDVTKRLRSLEHFIATKVAHRQIPSERDLRRWKRLDEFENVVFGRRCDAGIEEMNEFLKEVENG